MTTLRGLCWSASHSILLGNLVINVARFLLHTATGSGNLDYEEFCVAMDRLGLGVRCCPVLSFVSRPRLAVEVALAAVAIVVGKV